MKTYQIQFICAYNAQVTYTVKAKNYDDAVAKFTKKYGTAVGNQKYLMGRYKIELIG